MESNLLSIDVGMKNLAFCLLKYNSDNKYEIMKWDVINICEENKQYCCAIEKGKKCTSLAKYKKHNEYYCKKHAKKKELFIPTKQYDIDKISKYKLSKLYEIADDNEFEYHKPINKNDLIEIIKKHHFKKFFDEIKPIRSDEINLVTLGKNMKKQFDEILSCELINLNTVIIENQISPIANRMKTLQGMIAQYFIMKTNAEIEFVSSGNKLKDYEKNEKKTYTERKKLSIEKCFTTINDIQILNKWIDYFNSSQKKDDLSDSFLQGLWYIKK